MNNTHNPIYNSPIMAYAYHSIILDKAGRPVDYRFLEVNKAFEELTGLQEKQLINRTVREVLPGIEKSAFNWIAYYGQIALEGGNESFEQYSEPLRKWYKIQVYSTEKLFFTTMFVDTTLQHIITESSREFNTYSATNIDYGVMLKQMIDITGARYAALNIFDENKDFTTKAIVGVNENIKKAISVLGFEVKGKRWKHDPDREEKIRKSKTTIFDSLTHLTGKTIAHNVVNLLIKAFGLGEVVVIKSLKEAEPVGDFTLIFEKDTRLKNQETAELYADLTGMLIARIRAEGAVIKSKQQYESLVNNIPGVTYRCKNDADWTMLFVSSNVEVICGYSVHEIMYNYKVSFAQLIHEQDREKVNKAVNKGVKLKKPWEVEYRLLHKDGTTRWVYEKGNAVYDENEIALFQDGFILDITEKKNTENQLNTFFNINPDLLCIADVEGNFIKVNREWEKILGYTTEEIEQRKFFEFVHPDDMQSTFAAMEELGNNNKVLNFVNRLRSIKGSYRFIEWSSQPHGSLIYAAARDITEHLSIQEQLKSKTKQYELAINGTNDGIWDWDMTTNDLFLSRRWKEILGYEDNELKNEFGTFISLVFEDDLEHVNEYVQQYLSGAITTYNLEFRMKHKDGTLRWILAKGEALRDENGKPYRMAGSHSDITDRKNAEAALHENKLRLELAMDAGEHGFWDWNLISNETYFSPVYYTMLGYEDRELPMNFHTFNTLIHPEDKDTVMPLVKKSLNEGMPYSAEFRLLCKNGLYKWINGKGKTYLDKKNKPYRAVGVHIDIHELKTLEIKLKQNTDYLNSLISNTPAIIYSYKIFADGTLDLSYVSENVKNILGFTPNDFVGNVEFWAQCVHPDDIPNLSGKLSGKESIDEYRFLDSMGNYRWLNDQQRLIKDENGIKEIVGTWWDNTEQKNAGEQLQESQLRLSVAIDGTEAGIWDWDITNNKVVYSVQWKAMLGYEDTEIENVFEGWKNLWHPDDVAAIEKSVSDHLNGLTEKYEVIHRCRHKDGSWRWIMTRGKLLKDKNNKPYRWIGTNIDITRQKQAEIEIHQQAGLITSLLNSIPDLIFFKSADGVYLGCNPAFAQHLGIKPQDIVGKTDFDLYSTEDAEAFRKNDQLMLEKLEPRHNEESISYPDGKRILIETLKTPYRGADGSLIGILGISRDITERKNAEQTQRQLLLAQKTVEFKQNFLANMSHEIRTPLTGILGMTEIIEQSPLNDLQKDYLQTIKSSGRHLKEVIDQVLDFSKLEAGEIIIKPVVFQLGVLLNDVVELNRYQVKQGVQLIKSIDPKIPAYIEADRFRLSQALNNFISNAIKFTNQGTVKICSHLVSLNSRQKECVIKVKVSDTGLGISDAMQKKLFTPFCQIEMSDTREYDGTGLGLSITKQLIEMLGGQTGVISELDKGSTFWFTFKATIANEPVVTARDIDTTLLIKKLRILLAEDKLVNQKVIKLILNSMGHEVNIACNGKKAVELFEPDKFDLILMDIQMPVMDGVTATQKLKDTHTDLPPIVGLSANAFEGDRQKYIALGMDEYLTKPVKKEDFNELIRKLFLKK